jgi:hypothetical protein
MACLKVEAQRTKLQMEYPDGSEIRIGDLVWWDEGAQVGRVAYLVSDADQMKSWGLHERGIFIDADAFSRRLECVVFYPLSSFEDEGIGILSAEEWAKWRNIVRK